MLASRAVEVARGYDKIAPEVPHALHMPSHIFVCLGMWPEAIDWNVRSAAAAKQQPAGDAESLHYIHALDYLMYAYLQRGQDQKAGDVLERVNAVERCQDSFASAYGIAASQARYPLERGQWAKVASLPLRTHGSFPWDKYPWFEGITYFARGLGARSGDIKAAQEVVARLNNCYDRSIQADQDYWAVHIDVQRQTVNAWIKYSQGDKEAALKVMRQAADLEDSVEKHPVTPSPVLPARELLGDLLLESGKYADALRAYRRCLEVSPNRLNSIYGAARAAQLHGDLKQAESYYRQAVKLMAQDSNRQTLQEARRFLAAND